MHITIFYLSISLSVSPLLLLCFLLCPFLCVCLSVSLYLSLSASLYLLSSSLHIVDISLDATGKVKNLAVTLDDNLSMSFLSAVFVKILMFNLEKLPALEIVQTRQWLPLVTFLSFNRGCACRNLKQISV